MPEKALETGPPNGILIFQSDFGLLEGSVAQMYGVALKIDLKLRIFDITHSIEAFNTWDASYSLFQTCPVFPGGCVFVSVVDPGVGTDRRSVVALTRLGHYVVTPDNGTLTHICEHIGIVALREIDESVNRLPGSEKSHVFHGRDVYAYTGARLASGIIDFDEVGRELDIESAFRHPIPRATIVDGRIEGMIDIKDPHFGMVWTNIPISMIEDVGFGSMVEVEIRYRGGIKYQNKLIYGKTFGVVEVGEDVLYNNEIGFLALGTNKGSFVDRYDISSGYDWTISIVIDSNELKNGGISYV